MPNFKQLDTNGIYTFVGDDEESAIFDSFEPWTNCSIIIDSTGTSIIHDGTVTFHDPTSATPDGTWTFEVGANGIRVQMGFEPSEAFERQRAKIHADGTERRRNWEIDKRASEKALAAQRVAAEVDLISEGKIKQRTRDVDNRLRDVDIQR